MKPKQLSDEDLDALIVSALARLPAQGPSRHFANRVMERVQLPPSRVVVLFQRARAWASQPRRAMAIAGSYAVMAVMTLGLIVPWLRDNAGSIGFAIGWAGGRLLTLAREISVGVAGWVVSSGLADAVQSLPLSGAGFWVAGLALFTAYAGCAVGLHKLLRAPRGKHEPVGVQA